MYVVLMPEDDSPHYYARAEPALPGNPHQFLYHIQKLGTPHDTGTYVSTMRALRTPLAIATLWVESATEVAHYTFQNKNQTADDEDEEPPQSRHTCTSPPPPPSITFPIAEGWTPQNPHPDPHYAINSLPQLSIKRLTKLFTHQDEMLR